ncbi:Ureidoglycolate dehydrogenase (NAD(+)) [compost metagenome]
MSTIKVRTAALARLVAEIFELRGLPALEAAEVADALVDADRRGIPSHGVMLVPMYVERMQLGSVSAATEPEIVSDSGACVVLDARHMLGQLSSRRAVRIAGERSGIFGVSAVAVRNAFHFGAAGRYAEMLARAGKVGIVMSNTRPLMPAPGGAEAVVGNNPMAIAVPTANGEPLLLDMAMSATAMGKIRLAATAGQAIPPGWAVDSDGNPTTDAAAAIAGMLLPAAGPKGFGLALMVDLLCGALSGGGTGRAVQPLYGMLERTYNCAHFFLSIDLAAFGEASRFTQAARQAADAVRGSKPASGVSRVSCPGDLENERFHASAEEVALADETRNSILSLAVAIGATVPHDFHMRTPA